MKRGFLLQAPAMAAPAALGPPAIGRAASEGPFGERIANHHAPVKAQAAS